MKQLLSLIGMWFVALGSAGALANCQLRSTEVPITMQGLRPLLTTKIDGKETPFTIDSGALYSMLTPAAAARLGLRTRNLPDGFVISGVNGTADASLTTVKNFTIAGALVPNIDFIVGGGAIGGESVGLLGQNVLGIFDVEYDLANGAMRFVTPKGCAKTILAYWVKDAPYLMVPMEHRETSMSKAVVTVTVNGVHLKAELDTGAPTSVLTVGAARRAGIRTDGPGGGVARSERRHWFEGGQIVDRADRQFRDRRPQSIAHQAGDW